MAEFSIVSGQDDPDFLDLPWHELLENWTTDRIVDLVKGRSRHVVRMVEYGERVYAIKETSKHSALHEYGVLRELVDLGLPTVHPVGHVTGRTDDAGESLPAAIITRYLDFSLPYGYLFATEQPGFLRDHLLDAAVILLVRLHTEGVFWGDASFGNVLFRRDAGRLMAYLVDAETTEVRADLSSRMRDYDLEIARENVAGGLFDLMAAGAVDDDVDPVELVDEMASRYRRLWAELTEAWKLPIDEQWKIRERINRLNELGFDVDEMRIDKTDGGNALWIQPMVVEEGHAHRRLQNLTGLRTQEGQARRLLNAIYGYGAWLEQRDGVELPDVIKAQRWLTDRYYRVLQLIPDWLKGKFEEPEIFHHYLNHQHKMNVAEQRDVPLEDVVASLNESWLADQNEERRVVADAATTEITAGDMPLDRGDATG